MKHLIDLHCIRQLPFTQRILHPCTLRRFYLILASASIMLLGSTMALHGHEQTILPHPLWDMVAYFIHACGGIPALKQIEGLWEIFSE